MTEVNLIGGFYKSKSLPFSAQDLVNWLPVPSKTDQSRSPIKLRGLPGLKSNSATVVSPLTITGDAPNGVVGDTGYSFTYTVAGGTPPYLVTLNSGALPDGTTLSTAGQITGDLLELGAFSFVVRAVDATNQAATHPDTIAVTGDYSSALLHFDGTATPSTFFDEFGWGWQRNPFTPPPVQSSESSANAKFGAGSLFCPGKTLNVSDWYTGIVMTNTNANFLGVLGVPNDFCMDAWVYITGGEGEMGVFGSYLAAAPGDFFVSVEPSGPARFRRISNPISGSLITGGTCPINEWFHIAASRQGSTVRLFLNGALIGSTTYTHASDEEGRLMVGNGGTNSVPMNGYIDEAHFTWGAAGNGAARYTSAFTPPTAPYPPP